MVLVEFELGVGIATGDAAGDGMVPDGISGAVQLESRDGSLQGFFSTLL